MHGGGRALRRETRRPRPLFSFWSGSREEAAMTDLLPFVTLSLMPRSAWCEAAERLRRGAVAERLAADLAGAGLTVVSGLARGVDSAAHRGAIGAGGTTIGVLGSGIDVIYPPEHKPLVRDIEQSGAVISELVPGTVPQPRFLPMRNRIISGLTRAVVVIEAGEKSGSLITARCALEQGRDVLAVPGNVLSGRNRGAHALLRDGATIVESVDDILAELGMSPAARSVGANGGCDERRGGRAADPVLHCLTPGEPANLDEIAERSGLS